MITTKGAAQAAPFASLRVGGALAALLIAGAALAAGLFFLRSDAQSASLRPPDATALAESLTRTALIEGGDAQVILAPPAFFRLTGRQSEGAALGADRALVFVVNENVHTGELSHHFGAILRIDGTTLAAPTEVREITNAVHHRTSAVVFGDVPPSIVDGDHSLEMMLPGEGTSRAAMEWRTPLALGPARGGDGLPVSLPALLALFGGLLASMWPCLFQLSAYFLPSVAGLSLAEADRGVRKAPVLRTAVLFVSGIVAVYTVAGAAAGFAAQSLSGTSVFDQIRGPLTVGAGVVVLAMAARIAVQARAPLVCKMPVMRMAGRFGSGPLGTVVLGLAFATGCMTCFGAAIVLGMFAYVFTTASPLVGAAVLFVFSLGIAVPLVVAAVAMARVLPLLGHLERNARYLSLASSAVMALYGVLLLTGSTHVLSDAAATIAR